MKTVPRHAAAADVLSLRLFCDLTTRPAADAAARLRPERPIRSLRMMLVALLLQLLLLLLGNAAADTILFPSYIASH
eukprot:COSAG06_NODE_2827_length_6216_cov_1.565310_5_plen_77_part_00